MAFGNIKNEIANKYSDALFQATKESKALDAVVKDSQTLMEIIQNKDMAAVISNPLIKKADKKAAFSEFSKQLGWNKETLNFIFLMIDNNRIFAIKDVMEKFLKLVDTMDGKVGVTITSVHEISKNQQDSIRKSLEDKLGKPIKLSQQINPKILGGLQLKIDSLLIDGSLQGKLQRLKNVMKGVN